MKRLIDKELDKWDKNPDKLPLFVLGARQIGKTYSVKEFAKRYYSNKTIYINFLYQDDYFKYLNNISDPTEIINTIKFISKKSVNESWLIIFDEIQEVDSLKTSLKNFVDQDLKYNIICLGSYLGNTLNDKISFPVGKIERIEMFPLNFEEFLMALKHDDLILDIKEIIAKKIPILSTKHSFLNELLHKFMIIGGMPKVVDVFIKSNDEIKQAKIKESLIIDYQQDIIKYISTKSDKLKCQTLYKSIPMFLAKQNKKIILSKIDKNARYLNYASAIESLLATRIIYKINNINTFDIPLKIHINESEFKIYYNDVGFLSSNFNQTFKTIEDKENGYIRGSLAENFALSELVQKINLNNIFYYSYQDDNNNRYEIDFVIEDINNKIVPIEIKYGNKFSTKSLNNLKTKFPKTNYIIFSGKNFSYNNSKKASNIPLYAIGFLKYSLNRIEI